MALLEDPPFPTALVDLARRMTLPWRGWLTRLLAALQDIRVRMERVETTVSDATLVTAVQVVEADLGAAWRRSGSVVVELELEVSGPVVVLFGRWPRANEAQEVQLMASGEALGGRRMRVHWLAVGGMARGPVVFHVLTGGS